MNQQSVVWLGGIVLTLLIMTTQVALASERLQISGDQTCRTHNNEASAQAVEELVDHQQQLIRFRTRQMQENVPPQLIEQTQNAISDYQTAIELTEQTVAGQLAQAEWRKGLATLQLFPPCNSAAETTSSQGINTRLVGGIMVLLVLSLAGGVVIYRRRRSGSG